MCAKYSYGISEKENYGNCEEDWMVKWNTVYGLEI